MVYITELEPILEGDFYIDHFTRVYDKDKKPINCPICRNQIEYAYNTMGFHCTDNLLHCMTLKDHKIVLQWAPHKDIWRY
jgi:hypothetical protein